MRTFRFPWVALAMSFTTAVADGQRPAVPTAQPFVSAVGAFIALSVPDLEASAAWYEAKLGLHRIMTVPRTGKIAGVVALEGGG
ncbi:MAG: VOC family protein [Gemmatimonadetes bacterium]|nr:VOC family protein [Gemmatimonadota bacterium]